MRPLIFKTQIDAKRINDFLRERRDHGSSRVVEERVRFLTTESEINNNWRGAGNDKALLTIFTDFKNLLDQAKSPSRSENPNIELNLSAEAMKFLIDKGYDPIFGARPLKRTIQRYIENVLAEDILSGKFKADDKINAELRGETIHFEKAS